MSDSRKNFPPEFTELVRQHVERTRAQASGQPVASSQQGSSVIIGQFNEPVYTPVEEHLGGADPQSVPGIVDDYRDVGVIKTPHDDGILASEASKQAVERQRRAPEAPVKPQPPEDGSFSLDDHINYPLPEQPLPDEVNLKTFRKAGEPPLPGNVQHEELFEPTDPVDPKADKKKK